MSKITSCHPLPVSSVDAAPFLLPFCHWYRHMACISLDIRWVRVNCMSECDTVQHVSAGGRRAAVDVGNDRRVWHGRWYWHHCRGELTCYCRQAHRRRRLSCAHWLLIVYRITICLLRVLTIVDSLHFAWVIDNAKCTMVTRICVSVCLSVCLSVAACLHYCTDPDVTRGGEW